MAICEKCEFVWLHAPDNLLLVFKDLACAWCNGGPFRSCTDAEEAEYLLSGKVLILKGRQDGH